MGKFARIFDTKEVGQILIKVDADDDGAPEVRYFFSPENLGVCSMAFSFKDSDSGWEMADKLFEQVTEEKAVVVVKGVLEELKI